MTIEIYVKLKISQQKIIIVHCKSISKSFLLKIDFNHKLFCSQVPSNEDFHIFL